MAFQIIFGLKIDLKSYLSSLKKEYYEPSGNVIRIRKTSCEILL